MAVCDESKPYIFISYAHKDSTKVFEIMNRLKAEGYNVWYDGGIDPGTEWDENIANHVQNSSYFIGFVSNAYINSSNCKDELNYARDMDKEQLLVYIEDVELPGGMAMRMNRIQAIFWSKYDESNINEAYEKLFSAKGIEKTKLTGEAAEIAKNSQVKFESNVPTSNNAVAKKKLPAWVYAAIGSAAVVAIAVVLILSNANKYLKDGVNYLHANNVEYNPEKALEYFEQAEAKNNMDGIFLAGYDITFERGSKILNNDLEQGVKYLEMAKDSNPYAKLALGLLYHYGIGVEQDEDLAAELMEAAMAEIDVNALETDKKIIYKAEAYELLAEYYYNDVVETHDYELVKKYAEKAQENGSVNANRILGDIYKNGYGVEQNYEKALEWYKKGADFNDPNAMCYLAGLYKDGKGVEADIIKAMQIYNDAVEAGSTGAMHEIGLIYYWGNSSVDQDYVKSMEWFQKAEDAGNHDAAFYIGRQYAVGLGVEKDTDKALEWYTKAAEKGGSSAMNNLGSLYDTGDGVEKDGQKALEWYTKAAEKGNALAMRNIGNIYQYGSVGVEIDYAKALEWYTKATEKGNADAYFYLAYMYESGKGTEVDNDKAVNCYKTGAEKNSYMCMSALGNMYYNGKGVEQNYSKAIEWYEAAIENGSTEALVNLGNMYRNGFGVEKDAIKAAEYYQKAVDKGSTSGYSKLGYAYLYGEGVAQDYSRAKTLLEKAAESNDIYALYNLGEMYANAWGVDKDALTAIDYYIKASDAGHINGGKRAGDLYYIGIDGNYDYAAALSCYLKGEENGDTEVYRMIAKIYSSSNRGVTQDYNKVKEYLDKIPEDKRVSDYYSMLGQLTYYGNGGVAENKQEAYNLFVKGSEVGGGTDTGLCMTWVGFCYSTGNGVEQNIDKAIEWYTKAVEAGNIGASYYLGEIYEKGKGDIAADLAKAKEYYKKGADAGNKACEDKLAELE